MKVPAGETGESNGDAIRRCSVVLLPLPLPLALATALLDPGAELDLSSDGRPPLAGSGFRTSIPPARPSHPCSLLAIRSPASLSALALSLLSCSVSLGRTGDEPHLCPRSPALLAAGCALAVADGAGLFGDAARPAAACRSAEEVGAEEARARRQCRFKSCASPNG